MILLLVFLKINDTVEFKEGIIYSNNPQLRINTPDEVKVLKIFAKEGQEVKKGDTLFILENIRTQTDYDIAASDIIVLQSKITIIQDIIKNATQKKETIKQLIEIQSNIYKTDKKKTEQEISSINKKLDIASQQAIIVKDQYQTDSILYAKGVISRLEFAEQRNRKLDNEKLQEEVNTDYKQKKYIYENLINNYQKTKNDLHQNLLEIENQIIAYKNDIIELQSQIDNKKYNLNYITDELMKLIVLAPIDGSISNVFNSKQTVDIIPKGELLSIIAPKREKFYAKITLPEKDLTYVKKNQQVNMKIDAYNYYKFGAIRGNITYISPSDVDNNFYCIAQINQLNSYINLKAGYQFKGEIIIDEMKLYQYIIKKLFNKIDSSVHAVQSSKEN
jgi:multidrug resistance efflux pump